MSSENEITFQDYLYILFAKRWVILSLFLLSIGVAGIYSLASPKVYEASATLMIEQRAQSGAFFPIVGYRSRINTRNYCEILTSETVAKRAYEILKRELKNPILPPEASPETVLKQLVVRPITDSDIIKTYGYGATPEEAMAVANAVTRAFIEEERLSARKEFSEQCVFLEEQIPKVKRNLEGIEDKIREFKEENKIASLPDEMRGLAEKLADIDKFYAEAKATYIALSKKLGYQREQLAKQKSSLVEDITRISSPYILQLRRELLSLETNYSLYLVQGILKDSPKLLDLKNSIEATKVKLRTETKKIVNDELPSLDPLSFSQGLVDNILSLEVAVASAEARKNSLENILKKEERYLSSFPEKEYHLVQLEREREATSNTYNLLMENYEIAKISKAGRLSSVRIIDRATLPEWPIKPKKKLNLVLGGIIGIILGLTGAFLSEYLGGSLKTSKDVKLSLNLPTLGTIPITRGKPLLPSQPVNSPLSEAYRVLRANLGFISPDKPIRTLLVTSAIPGEGKSTVAANLAISMTHLNKKVLLIDADLRKSTLAELFETKGEVGTTQILIDKVDIGSAIIPSKLENLSLLPVGKAPPNPSELLTSEKMAELIKEVKGEYDYVILDSPPILSLTDAAIISAKVDGVLLVAHANKTKKLGVSHAKDVLTQARANILGIILNKTPIALSAYGYPYHSYYYSSPKEKIEKRDKDS